MSISDKQVKEFERKYKLELFGIVGEFSSGQAELIKNVQESAQYANINRELPNIGITLNNKIIELSHEFANSGISMFSRKIENYGLLEMDFIGPSFVGEALINNMIGKVQKATEVFEKYDSAMEQMLNKRKNKSQDLQKAGPIKNVFLKLRGWIMRFKGTDMSYTRQETEQLDSFLTEYDGMDRELWRYTLRENIIPSLVECIKDKYQVNDVPGLLEESVIPDLEKLGLSDLIPELKQKLEQAFEEEKSNFGNLGELSPELKKKIQQGQQETAKLYTEAHGTLEIGTREEESSIEEHK